MSTGSGRCGRAAPRRLRRWPTGSAVGALLVTLLMPGVASAQDPPAEPAGAERSPERSERWTVEPCEATDLWFHVLAVAEIREDGLLPLYSRDYAERVRARKDSLGIYPTMLDGAAARIRRTVEHDDRLQFVHVLPLYFPGASVADMLAALEAVARQRAGDRVLSLPSVRFGTSVAAEVFADSRSREFLGELVRVMRDEYGSFFRAFHAARIDPAEGEAGPDADWRERLERDLDDFLARLGIRHGTVVPSPAIGAEGRVVQFDPFGPEGRIVAAGMPLDGRRQGGVLNGVLKELCHVVVDRAGLLDRELDGDERRDLRTRAAVRCGAIVLEFHAPARLIEYRRRFVTAAEPDRARPASAAAFEAVFPLEPDRLERIRDVIRGR